MTDWREKYLNKVTCGDCLELMRDLPDGCVDAVVTDPPYGMNYESNHYKAANPFGGIKGDDKYPPWLFNESMRLSRKAVLMFCRWDNIKDMPNPTSVICWIKNNWTAGDLEHSYARQWEAIMFYRCTEHKFYGRPQDVIQIDRVPPTRLSHPTQKPVELIEWLIRHNTKENAIILDPFIGSGTTAVAAIRTGRQFIGFEIDPHYCEIANRRIADEQAKIPIPFKEYAPPEQTALPI